MPKESLFSRVVNALKGKEAETEVVSSAPENANNARENGDKKSKNSKKKDNKKKDNKKIEHSKKQVAKRKKEASKNALEDEFNYMMKDTGLTKEELKKRLKTCRDMKITPLSTYRFRVYGIYKMSEQDAAGALGLVKEMNECIEDLRWDLRAIDLGKMSYQDIEQKVRDCKAIMERLMTPEAKREIAGKVGYLYPETLDDALLGEIAADMEFTKYVLKYSHVEYISFHFYEKTVAERREFICDNERLMLQPGINSDKAIAILDDKLLTYRNLSEFYGRDFLNLRKDTDITKVEKFFKRNKKAVLKPRYGMLGKGVKLIDSAEIPDLKEFIDELINDENTKYIMEGLIEAAPEISALNPDSVNTVRFITYFDGENTSIRSCSMRIGHAGSFVDNAGAGGMTVSVDRETGVIISPACDEKGFRYDKHPESGITFKGYQLPAWDRALEVIHAVSGKIEGAKYVGWDLACNKDYEWVIVEGNGRTGFVGAQAPTDTGRRREFLNTIGADPRGALYNEVAQEMAESLEESEGIPADETMKKLEHFESLGLDGRYYKSSRAWELTDEECLALKENN